MSSINVKPGKGGTVVPVKTIIVDGEHIPVYIAATSDGESVDVDNPLPTANTARQAHNFARQEELLTNILLELRILNKYNSVGYDFELTDDDIEE